MDEQKVNSLEEQIALLIAENKKLKKIDAFLSAFVILVFVVYLVDHGSDIFR